MATVASVTTNMPLDLPAHASIARHRDTGELYVFGRINATNDYRLWRTNAAATTWSTVATFNRANLIEWSSVVVDRANYVHIAYRVSTVLADQLYYRRYSIADAQWSAELLISTNDNGGTLGSFWQGIDIAVVRHSNGSYAIATVSTNTVGTTKYGIWAHGVSITEAGKIYLNNPIINGQRSWFINGASPGRTTPSIDIEHVGDGILANTPALWVTWGRGKLYCLKLSWLGTMRGWNGPSSFQTIDSTTAAMDYVPGRWDGARWMMAVPDDIAPATVMIYERNQANNLTTIRQTPVHPTGNIRSLALSYDQSTKDIRVYAVGTSTAVLYYVDFVRSTGLWGSWTTVVADAVINTPPDEFSTRRGGTFGSARHDVVYATNASSPYDIKHLQQSATYAPSTPTWDTSATPYANGGAADVAAGLLLDWNFVDQDPIDTQSSYALRRQVGAGAFAWWRTSDSTWQAAETFNTAGTSAVTLPAAWGADADANHQYWVRVRDSTALTSGYSDPMVIVPSAKVNPTFTAPAAAAVLTTASVTISWTVAQQTQYRVRLVSGATVGYDSGWVTSTATSLTPDFVLPDGTAWTIELTTKNTEGLASTTQTRNFTVDFVEPTVPALVVTPDNVNGRIEVAISNPAPTGAQPAFLSQDLYRRPVLYANVIANAEMAGNTNGWQGVGGTLSYSTAQFAPGSGPGSARLVPSGAAAQSQVSITAAAARPAVAGKRYTVTGWIRPDTVNKQIQVGVSWFTAGGAAISTSVTTLTTHVAAVWYFVTFTAEAPATTGLAGPVIGLTGTPAAGDAFYADRLEMTDADDTVGTRVASGLAAGATIRDWRAGARTPYAYRAVAMGANGAPQASPWTT